MFQACREVLLTLKEKYPACGFDFMLDENNYLRLDIWIPPKSGFKVNPFCLTFDGEGDLDMTVDQTLSMFETGFIEYYTSIGLDILEMNGHADPNLETLLEMVEQENE